LHVIDRKHARVVRTFAGLRGDARFLDADRICHGMLDKGKTLRLDNSTGDGVPCEVASSDEPRGRLVFNGLRTAVFHDAFRGTVTLLQTGGAEKVVEDQGAWGVAVSSDGRGVAWSLGALAQPELVVYDPTHGRTPVGPGAQPSWLPDGRHFVYARPTSLPPGLQEAYESDLYLYDVVKQKSSRLTDTPTIAEMEPAVSPDGREVAFSDWRTGELLVAPLPGAVASKGGTP
jgi:Tol biopolymer transport system component